MLDLFVAAPLLVVASPLMLTIAFCIRLSSGGPAIFRQERAGKDGVPFVIFKFRTLDMQADPSNHDLVHLNERDGPAFKMEDDPRATRLGRWLRASGLDELPQLYNVLRNDMSMVGPRPLPVHEMKACEARYRNRLKVKPGLTCIWQVRKHEVSFEEWMAMDLDYVNSAGPLLDLKLIALTPFAMLRRLIAFGARRLG